MHVIIENMRGEISAWGVEWPKAARKAF